MPDGDLLCLNVLYSFEEKPTQKYLVMVLTEKVVYGVKKGFETAICWFLLTPGLLDLGFLLHEDQVPEPNYIRFPPVYWAFDEITAREIHAKTLAAVLSARITFLSPFVTVNPGTTNEHEVIIDPDTDGVELVRIPTSAIRKNF